MSEHLVGAGVLIGSLGFLIAWVWAYLNCPEDGLNRLVESLGTVFVGLCSALLVIASVAAICYGIWYGWEAVCFGCFLD